MIWDHAGLWKAGFVCHIGSCSVFITELWGVLHGLETCWQLGCRKVQFEVDSRTVLQVLDKRQGFRAEVGNILYQCWALFDRDWEVSFSHTFWEGNKVADCLALISLCLDTKAWFSHQRRLVTSFAG